MADDQADDGEARSRYKGTATELADVIAPFASIPNWFKYSEKDIKGSFKPKEISKHKGFFMELRKLQGNMSFAQSVMGASFLLVSAAHEEWGMSESQRKSQADVLARRVRTACRHIAQGMRG